MQVTIERLGHQGDGIARTDHGVIFVRGILPGETAEGTLQGDRLTDVRIVTPSPMRVKPPCNHARTCGGCQMQHASDAFVADWKSDIVRSALASQGLQAVFRPMHISPAHTRRRATLSGRRTRNGVLLGFHARGSDMIIPIPHCQLLHPDLIAAMPGLEALVKLGGSRTADVQLNVTGSLAGLDVTVTGGKDADGPMRLELARISGAHGIARLTWGDETIALYENPMQRMGTALVTPPPGAFLQATADGEAALVQAVTLAIGPSRRVVDLFAGCGTFTLPVAQRAEVHAVEGDAGMIRALDKSARQNRGLKQVTTETRDLFRRPLLPDEFKGFDAVVIDPPRAGAEAQIICLAAAKVPVVAAVSCNPVTFARDARVLSEAGYLLDWIQVIDQFRWSAHVELAARFHIRH